MRTRSPDQQRKTVLVFSRDPGPTNILIALLTELSQSPNSAEPHGLTQLRHAIEPAGGAMRIFAREPALGMWRRAGFVADSCKIETDEEAQDLIAEVAPVAVLTGSSDVDEFGDRLLWKAARTSGMASHVVLDHPANLATRFCDRDGQVLQPDWLYVADAIFVDRLVEAGRAREGIRVIGDLHHAKLRRDAAGWTDEHVAALRRAYGATADDVVVLFASECVREMVQFGFVAPYDEFQVLEELITRLAQGDMPGGGRIDPQLVLLVVRPHPRDLAGKFDAMLSRVTKPRAVVSAAGNPEGALLAADLVVGMCSSLLFEAAELHRPVVSLTGHDIAAGKSRAPA
jgi:hypothetical protein